MKIGQKEFCKATVRETFKDNHFDTASFNFGLASGSSSIFSDPARWVTTPDWYAKADITMNSAAREIYDARVSDETISITGTIL
jgi:hypothetical protein